MKLKQIIIFAYFIASPSFILGSHCTPLEGVDMNNDTSVEAALKNITFENLEACDEEAYKNIEKPLKKYVQKKHCSSTNFMKCVQALYEILIKKTSPSEAIKILPNAFFAQGFRGTTTNAEFFKRVFSLLINGIKQNLAPSKLNAQQKKSLNEFIIDCFYIGIADMQKRGDIGMRKRRASTGNLTPRDRALDHFKAIIDEPTFKPVSPMIQAYTRPISNAFAASNTEIPELQAILHSTPLAELKPALQAFYAKHTAFVDANHANILNEFNTILTPKIGSKPYGNPLSDEELAALCSMISETLHLNTSTMQTNIMRTRSSARRTLVEQIQQKLHNLSDASSVPDDIETYPFLSSDQALTDFKPTLVKALVDNKHYKTIVTQLAAIFNWDHDQQQQIIEAIDAAKTRKEAQNAESRRQQEAAEKAENERQQTAITAFMIRIKNLIDQKNINQAYNFNPPFGEGSKRQYRGKIRQIAEEMQTFIQDHRISGQHQKDFIQSVYKEIIEKLSDETGNKDVRVEITQNVFQRHFAHFTAS